MRGCIKIKRIRSNVSGGSSDNIDFHFRGNDRKRIAGMTIDPLRVGSLFYFFGKKEGFYNL